MQRWSFRFISDAHYVSHGHACAGGGYRNTAWSAFMLQFTVGGTASRFGNTW